MVCTPDLYYQEFVVSGAELRQYKHKFLKRLDMYHDLIFDEKEKAKVNINPEDFLMEREITGYYFDGEKSWILYKMKMVMKQWRNGKMNNQIRTVLKKRYEADIADAKYKIKCFSEHEIVIPEHPDITGRS